MLYMGLDVGTQGVRCVVVREDGALPAAASVPFASLNSAQTPGWYEQRPEDWKSAAEAAISDCVRQLKDAGCRPEEIRAVSIDGTSGTIVPLDASGAPVGPGILYNDPRARAEAAEAHAALPDHERRLGLKFSASFSLPRVMWLTRHCPDIAEKTAVFAHQADYIAGLLCGEYAVSDYSNALKTGYDLIDGVWPAAFAGLGVDAHRLPSIVPPGQPIARISADAARRLGLSQNTMVVGGSTDGYASALAAGAVSEGRWASIIGTTFVLKGVTANLVHDPDGAAYSHRLPSGEWLLGGAGNIGGRCMNEYAMGRPFDEITEETRGFVPTGARCYPLTGRGERFPFADADFEAFYCGNILGGRLWPAMMEGVGFAERYALEKMQSLGAPVGDEISVTGGVCRSDLWLTIRASILRRRLKVPRVVDAALGSALLAASGDFGSLRAAADRLIQWDRVVEPDEALARRYDEIYPMFVEDLARNRRKA